MKTGLLIYMLKSIQHKETYILPLKPVTEGYINPAKEITETTELTFNPTVEVETPGAAGELKMTIFLNLLLSLACPLVLIFFSCKQNN